LFPQTNSGEVLAFSLGSQANQNGRSVGRFAVEISSTGTLRSKRKPARKLSLGFIRPIPRARARIRSRLFSKAQKLFAAKLRNSAKRCVNPFV